MVIVETSILSDDDCHDLQLFLVEHPQVGRVIPGGGGLRKIRWKGEGRGKRGGVRIIYYWFTHRDTILFLFMYPKNVQDDLTSVQLRQLRKIIEEEFHGR